MTESLEEILQERDQLRQAAKSAKVAMDRWLHTYAPEFCEESTVQETRKRLYEDGGTLFYIATVTEQLRKALKEDGNGTV